MSLIVVTGGIGCGKSTLLKEFSLLGGKVADADELAHEAYLSGTDAFVQMVCRWGRGILGPHGEIERRRVASIVFHESHELAWLNELIHPRVLQKIGEASRDGYLFCAIPLYYESGWNVNPLAVISTWCDAKTQKLRLRERGWSDDEITRRLSSQITRDEKLNNADYGIITSCSWEVLRGQCRQVFNRIVKQEAKLV